MTGIAFLIRKVTLLHGQRRIGKSSLIRNIPKLVPRVRSPECTKYPDYPLRIKSIQSEPPSILGLTRVVIFSNPDSSYSDSMREEFTKIFKNLGGEVLHKPQIHLAIAVQHSSCLLFTAIPAHPGKASWL
ncbi:MAG: hypothetical protein ACYT04_24655 [Nostoc sp.]